MNKLITIALMLTLFACSGENVMQGKWKIKRVKFSDEYINNSNPMALGLIEKSKNKIYPATLTISKDEISMKNAEGKILKSSKYTLEKCRNNHCSFIIHDEGDLQAEFIIKDNNTKLKLSNGSVFILEKGK